MLKINKLNVGVEDKTILNDINLNINKGELHVIMGRNGTGKSTLSNIIAGKEGYNIGGGKLLFKNKDLLDMSIEDRALEGIFMSFQYPVSIPGLNTMHFLRTSVNSIRKHQNKKEYTSGEFIKLFKEKLKVVGLDESFARRSVNDGFSGGEKKRFEILQMLLIEPKLIILDETDSGLDIDALKIVANGINNFKSSQNGFLLITHYYRIIEYLNPDFVHVLLDGKIVKSGDKNLALKLEKEGYGWLQK
ncbi:MAG: Fe-S cluster assembly ATPase SufC [Candidatus Marinimicrobia bacterium]|nr:Fe-S cluster assembly ATPase SufC [Candidatus Neomarinimicrobiota bacterium]|tara:strand:- start:9038 stop:9778 length:741 start_codon:yes stop_codon:yes gene_type:complete